MERKFWKKLIAVLLVAAVLCTTFIMRLSVFGQDGEQISEAYSDYDIFTEGTRDQGERTEIEQEALNAAAEGSIEAEAVIDSETENGVSGSAETIQPGDGTVPEEEAPWEPGDGTVPEEKRRNRRETERRQERKSRNSLRMEPMR